MIESSYIWEVGSFGIIWDKNAFTCTEQGSTCAETIAAFAMSNEGLALAMVYIDGVNRRRTGERLTKREDRDAQVRTLEHEARRIFALGRQKAHAAWLDRVGE